MVSCSKTSIFKRNGSQDFRLIRLLFIGFHCGLNSFNVLMELFTNQGISHVASAIGIPLYMHG